MKLRLPVISMAVAILSGLALLYLAFFPSSANAHLRALLLGWAASLGGIALFIGILNLLIVHVDKLSEGGRGAANSGVLVAAAMLTFILALAFGPNFEYGTGEAYQIQPTNWLFRYIQFPIETSLMAVLAVSLIYAAARLLRRRPNAFSIIFLATVLFILLGNSLVGSGEFGVISTGVTSLRDWITQVPAAAGARGLLIGVALGTIATGLRILMGTDRPYGG